MSYIIRYHDQNMAYSTSQAVTTYLQQHHTECDNMFVIVLQRTNDLSSEIERTRGTRWLARHQ